MRNLEYKARVDDLNSLEKLFEGNGAVFIEDLDQVDTYFCVSNGRMKLRETVGKGSELIFYERDENFTTSMQSDYDVVPLSNSMLKNFLARSLGVKVVIEKRRRLLKLRNARIHLDQVKGLGDFLEFEVVTSGRTPSRDVDHAADVELLEMLKGLARSHIAEEINRSYSDLKISSNSPGST